MSSVAIIGAGLSGLTLALKLQEYATVTLFEKARGVGGRIATKYAGGFEFDHGAQFFRARSEAFKNFIAPLIQRRVIQRWDARFLELDKNRALSGRVWNEEQPHYVGVPSMDVIPQYLAQELSIYCETEIRSLKKEERWELLDTHERSLGKFDWVVMTAPAAQTLHFLPQDFQYRNEIAATKMIGCYSLMLGWQEPLPLEFDAALVRGMDISWISVNSSKPGRKRPFTLLVHGTNKWSDAHLEDSQDQVLAYLAAQTSHVIGHDVTMAQHQALHRWRFANISKQEPHPVFIDAVQQLAVCGDWTIQGRVESAFTSGTRLAEALLELL